MCKMTKKEACHKLATMNKEESDLQDRIDECLTCSLDTPDEIDRIRRLKEKYTKERDELRVKIETFMREYADILYN